MNRRIRHALTTFQIEPETEDTRPPIDLTKIAHDLWGAYAGQPVVLPSAIERYLQGIDFRTLSVLEIDNIEYAIERHYGIGSEYVVTLWPNGKAYLDHARHPVSEEVARALSALDEPTARGITVAMSRFTNKQRSH